MQRSLGLVVVFGIIIISVVLVIGDSLTVVRTDGKSMDSEQTKML
jgi:hypothetical protein